MCKQICLVILLLYTCSSSFPQSAGKVKARYNYLLYLPKKYSAKKAWPVIFYLHGGSQKGNDLNKLKVYGPPAEIEKGRQFDCIIVSPQSPDGRYWSTENWFDSLYAEITSKYRIDTNRVYLTGISMGGYGTFITAMDYPTRFAAIAPLCGGCNDSDTTRICDIKKLPVLAYHGTADDMIPYQETKRIADKLQQCGGNIMFTTLEGEGHALQYLYEDKHFYKRLMKYRLK